MILFSEMALPHELQQSLSKLGFATPTPIQASTIPLALTGKDILGTAKTGTGKTLAFMLPVLAKLINNPNSNALILAPTRELAEQVLECTKKILPQKPRIFYSLLIGGASYNKQFAELKRNPRLVIATPGRIIDHLKRQTLHLKNFDFLVIDEMDRMFDMGFSIQIKEIMQQIIC